MRASPSILPMIVDAISLQREGATLLDQVSFTLPQGGITAIIGPNGAGKTLTLRLCQGLITPSTGRVVWAHNAPTRRAMVFQHPVMLRRSVRANIEHTVRAIGGDTKRIDAALSRFALTTLANRPARLLSGGEQQRLAIARAWAQAPELLLLDEPSSQLDPGQTRDIEMLIQQLAADGITILMTTHDLGQARRLAKRILFFNRGRLIEDNTATSFFTAPATQEAQTFLTGELLT